MTRIDTNPVNDEPNEESWDLPAWVGQRDTAYRTGVCYDGCRGVDDCYVRGAFSHQEPFLAALTSR